MYGSEDYQPQVVARLGTLVRDLHNIPVQHILLQIRTIQVHSKDPRYKAAIKECHTPLQQPLAANSSPSNVSTSCLWSFIALAGFALLQFQALLGAETCVTTLDKQKLTFICAYLYTAYGAGNLRKHPLHLTCCCVQAACV